MAQGRGGHSTSNVMHHLKGVKFPASRADLTKLAKKNHADKEIFEVIGNMPDEEYASVAEVRRKASIRTQNSDASHVTVRKPWRTG